MLIKIRPLDTLFFRDGKPFTMGEESWANTIFPPPPTVIYGALRSCYFASHISELSKAAEENDPTKNLKINGIYFADEENDYFPLPRDCVQIKDEKNKALLLKLEKMAGIASSCPTKYVLQAPKLKDNEQVEAIQDGLIKLTALKDYLKGKKESFSIKPERKKEGKEQAFSILKLKDKVLLEPKVGIGLNRKTGTADDKQGKLYHISMNRLKDFCLLVDFEGLKLDKVGLMKLGGEGKAVSYQKEEKVTINSDKLKLEDQYFKLYLSTPAIFENGWFPSWLDQKTLQGTYNNSQSKEKKIELELLTAAIGKYKTLGGFDMKLKRPKPMYRVVPAGSVYYFKVLNEDTAQRAFDLLNNKAISDVYAEQGFGLAHIGRIHEDVNG
ncbi:MAG: type III-B CRISPR module-associated protein Cmr3 [Candidatus Heimdallarchaeota archaeon]|nr:type III-B CRISPR module-associated protein Cmr3 [Candidatus Heimdallarchaeota archaeon]